MTGWTTRMLSIIATLSLSGLIFSASTVMAADDCTNIVSTATKNLQDAQNLFQVAKIKLQSALKDESDASVDHLMNVYEVCASLTDDPRKRDGLVPVSFWTDEIKKAFGSDLDGAAQCSIARIPSELTNDPTYVEWKDLCVADNRLFMERMFPGLKDGGINTTPEKNNLCHIYIKKAIAAREILRGAEQKISDASQKCPGRIPQSLKKSK